MSVSFASHGDTQAMLGGAKALTGKSQTIKDAIVWVYAQAITDTKVEGNKRCAGWAYLIRPDGGERQRTRVEIPTWMQGPPATRIDGAFWSITTFNLFKNTAPSICIFQKRRKNHHQKKVHLYPQIPNSFVKS